MAWYPGARKMELQPESDSQAAIRPTQFIVHSVVAPWDETRIYQYWRDSTNLESHFGLDYDGSMGQYIGTETRADANYNANRRPDGSGAVSIETASNTSATDPWTPEQVEALIKLGVWLHQRHGIPLRICRAADDPGYGYHRLWADWSASGTKCPGDARVKQFREHVFPQIVARAQGQEEDMTPEQAKLLADTAAAVKRIERDQQVDPWRYVGAGDPRDMHQVLKDIDARVKTLETTGLTEAQAANLAARVAAELAERLKA